MPGKANKVQESQAKKVDAKEMRSLQLRADLRNPECPKAPSKNPIPNP